MSEEIKQKAREEHLATFFWTGMYENLTKHGVKFPENFDGVGAAYSGLMEIQRKLETLLSQALQKRDEAILNKIKEYRCHMDEIHCSCMEALVEFINN